MDKPRVCYNCEPCGFTTDNKTDYERHLTRKKHIIKSISINEQPSSISNTYTCPLCYKSFKCRTSIYKHKAVCKEAKITTESAASTYTSTPTEQYLLEVITKNQELTSAMMILIQQNTELQSKMVEFCMNNPTSHNNNNNTNTNTNTNSHNTITNCNNPTFNMNMFLNEKCKDAMNMKDFVNSIQLNMTDLENVSRLGYVEGMSNIFIDNLQKTDVYKRPVHCSDIKRETLYVKEDDEWERDGPDHQKMTNAVLAVEHKNVVLVNEWAKANPRCMNSNTRENETYFRLSKAATDGEKDGNIDKVIRKVAKQVVIEKDVATSST